MQSGCVNSLIYVYMRILDMGHRVVVVTLTELGTKIRTVKISSGTSSAIFTKVCTRESFLLYSNSSACQNSMVSFIKPWLPGHYL